MNMNMNINNEVLMLQQDFLASQSQSQSATKQIRNPSNSTTNRLLGLTSTSV